MANFACPRTCPLVGQPWCRFRPVLDALGPVRAGSHTVKIAVAYRDPLVLQKAVQALGGAWLGAGSHRLYAGPVAGHGFTLPQWSYPLVLGPDGKLAYDDFSGLWGNVADLDRLQATYALAVVAQAAETQGWLVEQHAEGLTIHHPSGGRLAVTADGTIDAIGFVGQGCHDAILALQLPIQEAHAKPEYSAVAAQVQLPAA